MRMNSRLKKEEAPLDGWIGVGWRVAAKGGGAVISGQFFDKGAACRAALCPSPVPVHCALCRRGEDLGSANNLSGGAGDVTDGIAGSPPAFTLACLLCTRPAP
jgi:hypothetical protein